MIKEKQWIRLGFASPALSPLVWMLSFVVSALLLFWSSLHLVTASVPHWLILGFMAGSLWLSRAIDKHVYTALAPLYEGGWMPSLQKTWLSLGLFALMGLAAYLLWWSLWLGVLFFGGIVFYAWRYLPRGDRKQGPLKAFSELVNSTERVKAPGIRRVEQVCLWACLFWILLSGVALLDVSLVITRPQYPVRLLGTEIHQGGKGGPTYSASVAGWRRPGHKISQKISRADYERLIPGKNYLMLTTRSLFGTERLKGFKHAPRPAETP